jgi:single stranded DNA-binding protein
VAGAVPPVRVRPHAKREPGRIEMINEAQVFLAGYVATEPTFRTTSRGKPEAQMRVGYTPRRQDRDTGEWADGPSSFVSVKCWDRLASNVAVCLRKGEPVVVMGRVYVRPYEAKDGTQRLSVDVYASSIGYDLSRGVARFSRTRPSSGETAVDRQAAGIPADPRLDDDDLADLAYRRRADAPEEAGGPGDGGPGAAEETADSGFFNDTAVAALPQQDADQPPVGSPPF